ncbi:MAG: 1-acyl-sn-glycerol-3-phosphate acyltransferase [Anaerolineae bacterium]|nr:1-acyl-sn-glycerol-3-phosphate acyltransferase [Phycisphaerae bacterium]
MGDLYYNTVWTICRPAFWTSSSPIVIGAEKIRRPGAYILASNHESPYDVPLLMSHCARNIDFVSITEVFRKPLIAWFYGSMNAFPLDRSRPDSNALRIILDRLERGRVVGMFPEGRLRSGEHALVHTRKIRPGVGRIAKLANVPIIPCIVINSKAYTRLTSWLPFRHTRYGVMFGDPIEPNDDPDVTEQNLVEAMLKLHDDLSTMLTAV